MCCFLATSMFLATGCDYENSTNNPDQPVPDPEGTITVNIADDFYNGIIIFDHNGNDACRIFWTTPDNFVVTSSYYSYYSYSSVSICNLGAMHGLGNITSIPSSGYTVPSSRVSSVACESGHGYVVKLEPSPDSPNPDWEPIYTRLYVIEPIVSTTGGIMGAKVKYQYPFE